MPIMTPGHIYILVNPAFPKLVKIGITSRCPHERAKELSATGVPYPFLVVHSAYVMDMDLAEKKMHQRFDALRSNNKREFFEISVEEGIKAVSEIVSDEKREEQARAERARAEQARAEEARAEQARAERARAERARAERARAERVQQAERGRFLVEQGIGAVSEIVSDEKGAEQAPSEEIPEFLTRDLFEGQKRYLKDWHEYMKRMKK